MNTTETPYQEVNTTNKSDNHLQMISHEEYQQRLCELHERVKELNCLYGISKLVEETDIQLKDILQGVVDQIPESWQYPEITYARITLDYQEYRSKDFRETEWRQAGDIFVNGDKCGTIEVYYLEQRPDSDEGPFLKEERNLLNVIAERLGNIVTQKSAEQRLQHMQHELELKARRLEENNTALKVLMEHQDDERRKMESDILQRLKVLVFPYLEKLKIGCTDESHAVYLKVIERNLHEITRKFSPAADDLMSKLAPSERQIANLIRDNRSTKEIARVLTMSENTVFFYRKSIRKKLNLRGQDVNLKLYLQSLYRSQ
ncbi:helix-turn-helix transcriptional regulator [Candidatus Latescibacterota bacterium]